MFSRINYLHKNEKIRPKFWADSAEGLGARVYASTKCPRCGERFVASGHGWWAKRWFLT